MWVPEGQHEVVEGKEMGFCSMSGRSFHYDYPLGIGPVWSSESYTLSQDIIGF